MFDSIRFQPRVELAPDKGASLNVSSGKKSTTKNSVALEELVTLLINEDIQKFNSLRPKGKIDLTSVISLAGKDLSEANLSNVDLSGVDMQGALLLGANLNKGLFLRTNLEGAILGDEQYEGGQTTARGAKFDSAQMNGLQAINVDFTKSHFKRASIEDSNLQGAKFIESFLNAASLDGSFARKADFTNARMHRISLNRGQKNTDLSDAILVGAKMIQASMLGLVCRGANMEGVKLSLAKGTGVDLSGANLIDADARKCVFDRDAKFTGAYVRDLQHDGFGVSKSNLLRDAVLDRDPPPGMFLVTAEKLDVSELINGIPGTNKELFDKSIKELESLIGLKAVKKIVKGLINFIEIQEDKQRKGLPTMDYDGHYSFAGPPGTGKTTVARIFSKLLHSLGYLEKGHLIEVSREGLVAGYKGQSAIKTKEVINSAIGGVLFIDEAYSLVNDPKDTFGKEATETLLKIMEDRADEFVVIIAGYTNEMKMFIESNPGFDSRISESVLFPDYENDELLEIYTSMLGSLQHTYDDEFMAAASVLFALEKAENNDDFGNGRFARNVFKRTVMNQSNRLADERQKVGKKVFFSKSKLQKLELEDLPFQENIDIEISDLDFESLTWIQPDGEGYKELTYDELTPDMDPYPMLSPVSLEELQQLRSNKL